MTTELSTDFGDLIAQRIREHHRDIAERWLHRLEAILPVGTSEIFPSADVLDHIPALIGEIAEHVGAEQRDVLVSNTLVLSKARELGELRFSQKASVHQLLREYQILGAVLGAFVHEQFALIAPAWTPGDIVAVMNRLNEAVFVLLQTTVDTLVGRYTEMIEDQTTRLDGFNRMVSHELVLVNLVSNGIKYSDLARGGAFVEVDLEDVDGACRLVIRDNGLGIPTVDQTKVFRRFFRAHADRDGELGTDGVGLGLAIAAECVKAMRGTISFESAERQGTTFVVTLPNSPETPVPAA